MYSDTASELRSIRKTMIVLGILLLFVIGSINNNETEEVEDEDYAEVTTNVQNQLVPLGNGYFGLYSNLDETDSDPEMKIYYYDEKENKLVLKKEEDLDTVEISE
ncbi:hypothetical protein ABE65_004910 [Fictibacillus phosphorivorans]|uniref:Uncharacterized protein n=1 Tax=Fictibacillus phosphorivorans TaxID=1221500 RepID=A0A168VU27_9BACL|nr:hypothetical protein [Fictibacillus phosphorivorans]ANC76185.1 hypothetical protein ABE65_004910 [Fictibacillus phosphorivorans]